MEEDNAVKKTEATVSPEFLGDVDEHRHLSDREEDEEVATSEPSGAPVIATVESSEVVEDMDVGKANHQQDSPSGDRGIASAATRTEPTAENIIVHESLPTLEKLQKSLDDVSSAKLGNGNDEKPSREHKEATSKAAAVVSEQPAKESSPHPTIGSKLKTPSPSKRNKLPRVAALQKPVSLPKDTYQPSKTQTKKMTSLPRVAMLQKTRPVNTANLSSDNAKPAKKLTGLPRVAMLQPPSHHPPAKPHHPVSKQERDLLECQKKFKAKPLPKSLYSGTKASSSTLNPDEPEYMKPTLSYLAKVRAPATELPHQDTGTTAAVEGPPKLVPKKSPSPTRKNPPKTAKDDARKTGDELDELLGEDGSPLPPSKAIDQKSSPDDVQTMCLDEDTTKPQEGTSMTTTTPTTMEPTKLEFD